MGHVNMGVQQLFIVRTVLEFLSQYPTVRSLTKSSGQEKKYILHRVKTEAAIYFYMNHIPDRIMHSLDLR